MPNVTFSVGSGVADSIFGLSQAPIQALIEHKAEAFEQQSMVKKIFHVSKSKHPMEKFTSMTEMRGPEPTGEGGAVPVDGNEEGFSKTMEHMVWQDSFDITREAIDDDRTGLLKKRPTSFTRGFYRVKEDFAAHMLGGALLGGDLAYKGKRFSTLGADGKPFFSKEHPYYTNPKKSQSNLFAGALTAANLGKLETHMQNFEGDTGELLGVAPKTIIIPNDGELKNAAFEAVGSNKDPESGDNAMNYQYGRWNIIIWPYLNFLLQKGMKPWFLMDGDYNEEAECAVLLQRVAMQVTSTLNAAKTINTHYGYERYAIGFNDFRGFAAGGVEGGSQL